MSKQLYLSLLDTEHNRELRDAAKQRAKDEGRTQSDIIASALAAYLGRKEQRPSDVFTHIAMLWLENDRDLHSKAIEIGKGDGSPYSRANNVVEYLRDHAPRMMKADLIHHALCLVSVLELAKYLEELEKESRETE